MKVLKSKIYILLLCSLCFASCERDADNVTLPHIESKLVVQCFISPQNPTTKAYVSFSSPIYGMNKEADWITDADVKISDGTTTQKLTLNTSSSDFFYEIDSATFKIETGKTYFLYVTAMDGRQVNAKCTVPAPIDGTTLTYNWDTIVNRDTNAGSIVRTVRLDMKWRDYQSGRNNFRAGANGLIYKVDDTATIYKQQMENNNLNSDLYTDVGKEGSSFERNSSFIDVFEQTGGSTGNISYRPKGIEIYILSCDDNYYKYHKTAETNNGNDPFSEPSLVFSNIIGGLGCFGASNAYIKTITF